jgi:formylglycine-generating enzyme required for sulfatase activity
MAVNGQRVRIAWSDIQQMNSRQRILDADATNATPAASGTNDLALPATTPVAVPSMEADSGIAFGRWFRRQAGTNAPVPVIPLHMPWGYLEVSPDAISRIHIQQENRPALVLSSTGDVILADMAARSTKRTLRPLLEKQQEQTESQLVIPAALRNDDTFTLRLVRGDILTGTLPEGDIPFRPLEKNDVRTGIPAATLKGIMRTGEDTLFYITAHGTLIGSGNRAPLPITLAINSQQVEIPMHQIESLVRGNKPLPPSTIFTPGLPAALANEIVLQGGTFQQGSNGSGIPDESPCITVSLSPFILDATEITRAQFASFVNAVDYKTTAENAGSQVTWMNPGFVQMPDDPVVCVSWIDAAEFCNWRSRQYGLQPVYTFRKDGSVSTDRTANGYRLPTETEWEFAAGGSRKTAYPWGNSVTISAKDTQTPPANFTQKDGERDDGWRWTNPVLTFPPTPDGIYGMAGNAWEWCEDWYFNRAYDTLRNRTPFNPCIQDTDVSGLTHRVMRGGSYRNNLDMLRVTSRGSGLPLAHAPHVGFRCARNAE